jgi:hypothetical protein
MAWNGILSVFRFAKQIKIRRKKQNFRFSWKMAPLLLLSDHLLDFFPVPSQNNKWLKSVSFFGNISLGRRMFLKEKQRIRNHQDVKIEIIENKIMIDQKFKHSTLNVTAKPTRFRIRQDPHKFGSLESDLDQS